MENEFIVDLLNAALVDVGARPATLCEMTITFKPESGPANNYSTHEEWGDKLTSEIKLSFESLYIKRFYYNSTQFYILVSKSEITDITSSYDLGKILGYLQPTNDLSTMKYSAAFFVKTTGCKPIPLFGMKLQDRDDEKIIQMVKTLYEGLLMSRYNYMVNDLLLVYGSNNTEFQSGKGIILTNTVLSI